MINFIKNLIENRKASSKDICKEPIVQIVVNLYLKYDHDLPTKKAIKIMREFVEGLNMRVWFDHNEFDKYVVDNERRIKAFARLNYLSPFVMLVGYSFKTHMNLTIKNWPFEYQDLVDMLHVCNYSTDILYD